MGEKQIIDQAFVEEVQKSNSRGYYAVICILMLTAVLSLVFVPMPANFIVVILLIGGMYLLIRNRKKNGPLQVYFSQKPLVRKHYKRVPGAEDDADVPEAPYFDFGDWEIHVSDAKYDKANEGDLFYVMYNARNNLIVDCYSVDEYELDPSLDIR